MLPRGLDVAIDYAIQVEGKKGAYVGNSTKSPKKLNNVANIKSEKLPTFITDQTNTNKSVSDKLAALSAQIKEIYSKPFSGNTSSNTQNKSRSNTPYNRPGDDNNRNNNGRNRNGRTSQFFGNCFGCKEQGHTYMDCKKITGEKIDEIRSNYQTYVNESRAERAK